MIQFEDFEPAAFATLRRLFAVDTARYLKSLRQTVDENGLISVSSNSRSGSFFYFTHDKQLLVKSIDDSEVQMLQKLVPSYTEYVRQHKDTLLPRFYGCHAIKYGQAGTLVHFVVIANINAPVLASSTDATCTETYDLKGECALPRNCMCLQ